MGHFAFKYIAVIACSLMIFGVAQAESRDAKKDAHHNRKGKSANEDGSIAKMQERMKKNTHRERYRKSPEEKSELKK